MSTENVESGLSVAETAYFESGGASPLAPETETVTTEPAKVEAAEPAKPEDTQAPAQERDEKSGKFVPQVPHSVFHAEREERKRIAAERDELRSFKAAMEERQRWAKEVEQPANQMPGEDDPIGRLEWLTQRENERQEQTRKAQEEQEQTHVQNEAWNRNYRTVEAAFDAAAQADPTLPEAFVYIRDSYARELRAQGFNDQEVQHYVNQHGIQFVNTIAARQLDPAKFVKDLAESRGWSGPKKPETVDTTASDALKKVAAAQDASRTVAQAGSGGVGDETTLEGIMAMSRQEFDAWHAKPENARLFTKLLG